MPAQVIEGTWTEILGQADRFAGKRVRVQVIDVAPTVTSSEADFEADLDALSKGGEGLPVLSEEATTRAGIYADHD